MSRYAHYNGQRYDIHLSRENIILYWYDGDSIPRGFQALNNPGGKVKANKLIHCSESDCVYKETVMVNYKGYNFYVEWEKGDQLQIYGTDFKACDAAGLLMREPGIYENLISRNEGRIWINIEPLPPSYEGICEQDYVTFRFRKDGYKRGECFAHYKGQRYRSEPLGEEFYLLHWYGENDIPECFEVSNIADGNVKAVRRVSGSELVYIYREYIMATYKGYDYFVEDATKEQLLIHSMSDDKAIIAVADLEMLQPGVYGRWIPRSEGFVWVNREYLRTPDYLQHRR